MLEPGIILAAAYLLDLMVGDPPYGCHPVRLMGLGIARAESCLRKCGFAGKVGGVLLVLITVAATILLYLGIAHLLSQLHSLLLFLFHLYLVYSCLALGDLLNHVQPVVRALESGDMDHARDAVSRVVGRDVNVLDAHGLARAAVETLAENFVDGFLSPVFWYFAGWVWSLLMGEGTITWPVVLMLLFKLVSTLDSMVGYRNFRYLHFGWAGARLDDLMNFIPARFSILFLWLGAALSRMEAGKGLQIAQRDRLKHDSPNSAHAESFLAGVLGLRLGGPTLYTDGMKAKPWLGDGSPEVGPADIRRSVRLLRVTGWIVLISAAGMIFLIG
ncbi:MAG: cobalamin biosynthesis protein CobD [Deltaproteobacteria bacterium]|nr:cobalamin biosynthesis protein CobD [Deltaproteobacteria bacterium]